MNTFEFDVTYSAFTGERVGGLYVPTVEHDAVCDVLIDGYQPDHTAPTWHALTGHTAQHGYRGAVFHPSETADDDTVREWVHDAGGDVFAIVPVTVPLCDTFHANEQCEDRCNEADLAGWAIIYREAGA